MEMSFTSNERATWVAIAMIWISMSVRAQESVQYIYPNDITDYTSTTLCPLSDGGFYLARLAYRFGSQPAARFLVERMGADGAVMDVRAYDNGSLYSIEIDHCKATSDDGLLAIGRLLDPVSFHDSICVMNLGPDGAIRWAKALGANSNSHKASGIMPLADGGCLAYGTYLDPTTNKQPVFLSKFDEDGTLLWSTSIVSTIAFEHFTVGGVVEEANGDIWLAGEGRSSAAWLIRTNASGSIQQRYALDLPGIYNGLYGDVRGLFKRPDGALDLIYSVATTPAEVDLAVVTLNGDGNVQQTRTTSFTGNGYGLFPNLFQLANGDYLFTGDQGSGNRGFVGLLEWQSGDLPWVQRIQFPGYSLECRSVMPTADGAVRVYLDRLVPENDPHQGVLLRTSQWEPSCYTTALEHTSSVGSGSSSTFDVIVGPGPNAAHTTAYLVETDAPREAICGTVGIREEERPTVQVYPNPASGAFQVVVPEDMPVHRLRMFDASGRTVEEVVVTAGQRIVIDALLVSGLYAITFFDRGGLPLITTRLEVTR